MTEIINIPKEEVTYDRTLNHDQRTYSELGHNLNLVKQTTTKNLTEGTKLVNKTSHTASNTYNPWLTTSSNKT
jgi:hypothetical protein